MSRSALEYRYIILLKDLKLTNTCLVDSSENVIFFNKDIFALTTNILLQFTFTKVTKIQEVITQSSRNALRKFSINKIISILVIGM